MYLLIINNYFIDKQFIPEWSFDKQLIIKNLKKPFEESIDNLLRDFEIIWMLIGTFIKEYDDDPEGFYFDEKTQSPSIKKFIQSLSDEKFYNKVKNRLKTLIDKNGMYIPINEIDSI